jgi:hypothetical protein
VPWLLALAGLRLLGSPLLSADLLLLGMLVIHATGSLIVLSIIIVPVVAWYHARLCWRNDLSLRAHIRIGSTAASLAALVLFVISRFADSPVPSLVFTLSPVISVLYMTIAAGLIGALGSWSVWLFAVRPLRVQATEMLSRFD